MADDTVLTVLALATAFMPSAGRLRTFGMPVTSTLLFLPLDERFTTRDLTLNLARLAPQFNVLTPPPALLPLHKRAANPKTLMEWVEQRAAAADVLIASFEMIVYGGLIASRVSNDSSAIITRRVNWLNALPTRFPSLAVYLNSVVMRIPAYNGDFEEPWYYASYGRNLYEYSFHISRYRSLHNASDASAAAAAAKLVPPHVLSQFLWRRARNFNASLIALGRLQANRSAFAALYVTLDDGGAYGLNVDEAAALHSAAEKMGLPADRVKFYQGADEVGAVLLARAAAVLQHRQPRVRVVWRAPNATGLIPAFESQPISRTVEQQLEAAGATLVRDKHEPVDILYLVNNFGSSQHEASEQQPRPPSDYAPFAPAINGSAAAVVAIADVRYANGADASLVDWMTSQPALRSMLGAFAYAGWNTDSNSNGCAAANAVLLSLCGGACGQGAANFTLLRLTEDLGYQVNVRPLLQRYLDLSGLVWTSLGTDLGFYERFALRPLRQVASQMADKLSLSPTAQPLHSVYFPWNRTFEIGLELNAQQ